MAVTATPPTFQVTAARGEAGVPPQAAGANSVRNFIAAATYDTLRENGSAA
ncbi:MAG TPA: hypothetical protein VLW85_09500 [Myxococcales bacterium]|nr:hypothetical protein [Myxococcales bacterium]